MQREHAHARKIVAAADREEFDEIEPPWVEPIKRFGIEKIEPGE